MKSSKLLIILSLTMTSLMSFGQFSDPFLDKYSFFKSYQPIKTNVYKNIEGSPYLNKEFEDGTFIINDTTSIKLPIRYNIYTDEMEYKLKGSNFVLGNPEALTKVLLGNSVFLYLPYANKKNGFFEVYETGKCLLLLKRKVRFKEAEGPKAIVGVNTPAQFTIESDVFYVFVNKKTQKITNIKSLLNALTDQLVKMKTFIKQEKIRNTRKDNLIKLIKYYNSL